MTILQITTDRRMAVIVDWILSESGYIVAHSDTAADALAATDRLAPDLVIVDGPPTDEMRADALLLREAFPAARFIGLHGHNGAHTDHIVAEGHLHMPFHADDLTELVSAVMAAPVGARSAHLAEEAL